MKRMQKVNDILKFFSPSTISAICKLFNKFIMRSWHDNRSSSIPYPSLHAKHQIIMIPVTVMQGPTLPVGLMSAEKGFEGVA